MAAELPERGEMRHESPNRMQRTPLSHRYSKSGVNGAGSLIRAVRQGFMRAARYILFAMSGVFVAPIALLFLGSVLPLPDDGFLPRFFYLPHMSISYALYRAGASRTIVSAGGHLAHLTTLGIFIV